MAVSSPFRLARASGLAAALVAAVFFPLAYAGSSSRAVATVTPVEKVINLLQQLQVQVESEGKTEATQYDHYACFCKEQSDEKVYMIEKSTKKIAMLGAKVMDLASEISALNVDVEGLSTSIAKHESDIASAADARAKDHKAYLDQDADLQDAIASLKGAIESLKTSKAQLQGAKLDLVQVRAVTAPALAAVAKASPYAGITVPSVLAQLAAGKQLPPSYEYRSNGIITTLEELLVKFTGYKKDADKDEFDLSAAYEKKDLDLHTIKKFQEKEKALKESIVEKKSEAKSSAIEDLTEESKDKSSDQSFLDVLKSECEKKATDWDQRSQTRAAELTAIAGALKALSEGVAPSWSANRLLADTQIERRPVELSAQAPKHVVSFLQLRGAHAKSFGEVVGRRSTGKAVVERAARHLSSEGARLGSAALSVVAARVEASEDHFVKVRSIIKDLMRRLEDNADSEQTQKSYCDKWMAANVASRDKSKAEIESLEAEHSQLEAEEVALKKEIADLAAAISNLQKALRESTELRLAESAENKQTVETAKEGKATVELAISLLTAFYSEAAFVQTAYVPPDSDRDGKTVNDRAPEIWEGQYRGKQANSKGIVGLLQVILSDFTRTIDVVTVEEDESQHAFDDYEGETRGSIGEKAHSKESKEGRVSEITDALTENTDALEEQRSALGDAEASLQELKASCVDGEETYEERVAKRNREIEALKEAHRILDEWDA